MNKTFLGIVIGIIIIAGGAWIISGNSSRMLPSQSGNPPVTTTTTLQPVTQNPAPPVSPPKTPPLPVPVKTPGPPIKPPGPATFTMAEIASHDSAASCYTAISGSVYDLTSFINQHPGGADRILSICGIDGTAAFLGQHSGQSEPQQILATFKIGVVAP
jgi:hypothetical protein